MKSVGLFCLIMALGVAVPLIAQEGFPLTGTWSGDYGISAKEADRVQTTLILSWDGKTIQGLVDPGPDSAKIKTATLNSSNWSVRMEYDLKDKAGKLVPFIVTGTLKNPNSRKNREVV